jgi:hypothetical protein
MIDRFRTAINDEFEIKAAVRSNPSWNLAPRRGKNNPSR